jgi:primosomal protein N' (replication factor Y)
VPPRQRARIWRGTATGEVPVVVGARSALFLPFKALGLVIVDEEHDTAYKQDDGVRYHARDMAVVRGSLGQFPVILASATPSLETRANVLAGRYGEVRLPARIGAGGLPRLSAIDMRRHRPLAGRFLSPLLCEAVDDTLARGDQALLFLNRRGYAPLTLCRSCGHRFQCPQCSTWMVEHRFRGLLMCHCCGHSIRTPQSCPACGDVDSLIACGPGIERIAEEVAERFPDRRTLLLSSDLPGGTARLRLELDSIAKGEVELIIGTQLVAKGHNFPGLALVGVVDADLGLANGDPRAAERTFQLLSQVTGRAGRFASTGQGLLQTHAPEHPVMRAIVAGDRDGFYAHELAERQAAGMPPYGRLAALIVSADTRAVAHDHARAFAATAPDDPAMTVFGPVEAPIAIIRGRHRFRLLVRAPRGADVQGFIRRWLERAPRETGGRRVQIDIDPQSFL